MNVEKRGYRMPISLEVLMSAYSSGSPKRAHHYEPATPTPEQVAEHARAVLALKELESNSYVLWPRMDDEIAIVDLATERLVFDETHEDWMMRVRDWREGQA